MPLQAPDKTGSGYRTRPTWGARYVNSLTVVNRVQDGRRGWGATAIRKVHRRDSAVKVPKERHCRPRAEVLMPGSSNQSESWGHLLPSFSWIFLSDAGA